MSCRWRSGDAHLEMIPWSFPGQRIRAPDLIRTATDGTRGTDLRSNPLPIASLEQNVYDVPLAALHGVAECGIRKRIMQTALRLLDKEAMDRQRALDAALGQIERAFGKGSIMKLGSRESVRSTLSACAVLGSSVWHVGRHDCRPSRPRARHEERGQPPNRLPGRLSHRSGRACR